MMMLGLGRGGGSPQSSHAQPRPGRTSRQQPCHPHDSRSRPPQVPPPAPPAQLRFLVHFVGDLHQPLHAATMYSAEFPDGDLGGNYYKIQVPGSSYTTNLHSFWDSGAGNAWKNPVRPLNSTGA